MEIRRLSECSLKDVMIAWNRGFEGYFVPINMSLEAFLKRMVIEELSPKHSIVAFVDQEPIGIVMNGIRVINGKKVAWNGGTGISPSFRGKGLAHLLMTETVKIYKDEDVDIATLEAIAENQKAIELYKKYGYFIQDELIYMSKSFSSTDYNRESKSSYKSKSILPQQLAQLKMYKQDVPWQCQWQSVKDGEAIILFEEETGPIGYALYKRNLDGNGRINQVVLYQLHVSKEADLLQATDTAIRSLLIDVDDHVTITGVNLEKSNPVTLKLLELGFEEKLVQVSMKTK